MLLIGVVAVFVFFRRQRAASALPAVLTPEEETRLARLLAEDSAGEERSGRA
jgi:cytochrome c-type biogenesis protein CcmH/NrfF